jgi:hypothetical protein
MNTKLISLLLLVCAAAILIGCGEDKVETAKPDVAVKRNQNEEK